MNYRVRLWNHEPTGTIEHVDLEAEDPMMAAALGLQMFKRMGINVRVESSIELLPVGTPATQPIPTRDVIDWLTHSEPGQRFNRVHDIV